MPDLFSSLAAKALGREPGLRPVPVARFVQPLSDDEWDEVVVESAVAPESLVASDPRLDVGVEPEPRTRKAESLVRHDGTDTIVDNRDVNESAEVVRDTSTADPAELGSVVREEDSIESPRSPGSDEDRERPLRSSVTARRSPRLPDVGMVDSPDVPPLTLGLEAVHAVGEVPIPAPETASIRGRDRFRPSQDESQTQTVVTREHPAEREHTRDTLHVSVSIGRVEITAPRRPDAKATPAQRSVPAPRMSLEDYLKRGVRR